MKRKLPVYTIVDSSGSMSGEPIQAANNGAKMINRSGKTDPEVLETAEICYIEFNDTAEVVTPMCSFAEAIEPTFTAGGRTKLGAALDKLNSCIESDVQRGDKQSEIRGDYKALVFILTDGYPTDDWQSALNRLDRSRISYIVTCLASGTLSNDEKDRIKNNVLAKISGNPEHVFDLDSSNEDEIKKFFEFVSDSMTVASKTVRESTDTETESIPIPSFPDSGNPDSAFF